MSKDIDIFQESNQVATTNRTDGFSHTVTGSSSTAKRISIKGGMFRLVINGEELDKSEQRHLDVVIVNAAPFVSRMFFKDPYQRGVKMGPPTCWSSDAKTPNQEVELKQHENCELCPQNIKGSGANNTKACRYSRRIAVVMADNLEGDIYQVTLPALSIFGSGDDQGKPLHQYTDFVTNKKTCLGGLVTRMFFDTNSEAPKIRFRAISHLDDDQFKIIEQQGATEDAKRAITLTVAKKEPEGKKEVKPTENMDESDIIEAEKKTAIPEPVKRSSKSQPSVEKEQLDLFAEENKQTEPPKSDTDEVSLDDLVSDWEDKEDT